MSDATSTTGSTATDAPVLRVGHSPDPDDAFMFYGLAHGAVKIRNYRIEHVLEDIESLNRRAMACELEVTAISAHAYPRVASAYHILATGASMGRGYGPILASKTPMTIADLRGKRVAIPGPWTTAALLTAIYADGYTPVEVMFDQVPQAILSGEVDAGVIIHEGQLTYKEHGLVRVVDFGQWWSDQTEGLPLPLGGNGIRRDIPADLAAKISLDLKRSIAYALGHREEALAYAMKFGRNLPKEKADRFVGMYVNDLTLDYGERGRQALQHLYDRAYRAGLLAEPVTAEFLG